jgi:H+/gluconate symporter-like permease
VLRGGSWNNNQNNARAASRNNNNPNNRNNNNGFRVVVGCHVLPLLLLVCGPVAQTANRAPTRGFVPTMPADYGLRVEAKEEE